jgi:hypothetical protein
MKQRPPSGASAIPSKTRTPAPAARFAIAASSSRFASAARSGPVFASTTYLTSRPHVCSGLRTTT